MIAVSLTFCFACYAAALLMNLVRLLRGPGMADRVLALDTMVVNAIALLILYGIAKGTGVYFEGAMLFAMTGFVSTVAWCRFLLHGRIIG